MLEDSVLKIKDGEIKLHFGMWASEVYSEMMKPIGERLKELQKKEDVGDLSDFEAKNEMAKLSIDMIFAIIVAGAENARVLEGNFKSLSEEYKDDYEGQQKLKKVVSMWVAQAGGAESQQVKDLVSKFQTLNDVGEIKAETIPQKKTSRGKK